MADQPSRRTSWIRDNGLTLALALMFAVSLIGMALTGWRSSSEELIAHGRAGQTFFQYLTSGEFISALFENWESEFLQMATYVMLTAVLVQRGSAESKDPDKSEEPAKQIDPRSAPWPVAKGGWWKQLYAVSLGVALVALFVFSFAMHWFGSLKAANEQALLHGKTTISAFAYLLDARFWFESFQNWQSEFLSTAVLIVLSIFLRFRGSPESKPVEAPHSQTGA
ncbi:hypothetical protein FG93_05244 [Bosea sp. LC85]|uniref:DUF6766 family protein n=1 Tax=Bosea sp. LC85 TaxID=1502851 RepID=UPI0004E368E2|nr:DUF6766 family protein [Bosea sp. LC85]KFC64648.1 hypothetical protein FG93_05244 [Bosea sp. LC85]